MRKQRATRNAEELGGLVRECLEILGLITLTLLICGAVFCLTLLSPPSY